MKNISKSFVSLVVIFSFSLFEAQGTTSSAPQSEFTQPARTLVERVQEQFQEIPGHFKSAFRRIPRPDLKKFAGQISEKMFVFFKKKGMNVPKEQIERFVVWGLIIGLPVVVIARRIYRWYRSEVERINFYKRVDEFEKEERKKIDEKKEKRAKKEEKDAYAIFGLLEEARNRAELFRFGKKRKKLKRIEKQFRRERKDDFGPMEEETEAKQTGTVVSTAFRKKIKELEKKKEKDRAESEKMEGSGLGSSWLKGEKSRSTTQGDINSFYSGHSSGKEEVGQEESSMTGSWIVLKNEWIEPTDEKKGERFKKFYDIVKISGKEDDPIRRVIGLPYNGKFEKPHVIFIVHGTFAAESADYHEHGERVFEDVKAYAEKISEEKKVAVEVISFKWTGKDNPAQRYMAAGNNLALLLNLFKDRDVISGITTIAHSHGGNVVNYATNIIDEDAFIDNIINIAVPIKISEEQFTKPKAENFGKLYHFYSMADFVQPLAKLTTHELARVLGQLSSLALQSTGIIASSSRSMHRLEDLPSKKIFNIAVKIDGEEPGHIRIKEIFGRLYEIIHAVNVYEKNNDLVCDVPLANKDNPVSVGIRQRIGDTPIREATFSAAQKRQFEEFYPDKQLLDVQGIVTTVGSIIGSGI